MKKKYKLSYQAGNEVIKIVIKEQPDTLGLNFPRWGNEPQRVNWYATSSSGGTMVCFVAETDKELWINSRYIISIKPLD